MSKPRFTIAEDVGHGGTRRWIEDRFTGDDVPINEDGTLPIAAVLELLNRLAGELAEIRDR